MKILYNKHIPLKPFFAINVFGFIFCRNDLGPMAKEDKNHEYIHTLQMREMLYVFFYLWYIIEWAIRIIQTRSLMKAYYNIYFEREAYTHEKNLNYPNERPHFAWWHQFTRKSPKKS